jgi:hypothetical protein
VRRQEQSRSISKTTNTKQRSKAAAETDESSRRKRAKRSGLRRHRGASADLRGYFLNLSYTPLERPRELGDKAFYTPDEALAAFRKAVEEDAEVDPRTVHYDWKEYGMDAWQSPIRPILRTSLIVDPPDGRIPPMDAEKARKRAEGRWSAASTSTIAASTTRCITGNQGPPRLPGNHDARVADPADTRLRHSDSSVEQ